MPGNANSTTLPRIFALADEIIDLSAPRIEQHDARSFFDSVRVPANIAATYTTLGQRFDRDLGRMYRVRNGATHGYIVPPSIARSADEIARVLSGRVIGARLDSMRKSQTLAAVTTAHSTDQAARLADASKSADPIAELFR